MWYVKSPTPYLIFGSSSFYRPKKNVLGLICKEKALHTVKNECITFSFCNLIDGIVDAFQEWCQQLISSFCE